MPSMRSPLFFVIPVISIWLCLALFGGEADRPMVDSGAYEEISLLQIYREQKSGTRRPEEPATCHLVFGTIHRVDRLTFDLVQNSALSCCIRADVRLRLNLDQVMPEERPQTGAWVAVFGQLKNENGAKSEGQSGFELTIADQVFVAHQIKPAEEMIYDDNLVEVIQSTPSLSRFADLIGKAGLEEELSVLQPVTAFVPVNAAFLKLDSKELDNPETARQFVLRHLAVGKYFSRALFRENDLLSYGHSKLDIVTAGGSARIDEVRMVFEDQIARNGIVHIINQVIPEAPQDEVKKIEPERLSQGLPDSFMDHSSANENPR